MRADSAQADGSGGKVLQIRTGLDAITKNETSPQNKLTLRVIQPSNLPMTQPAKQLNLMIQVTFKIPADTRWPRQQVVIAILRSCEMKLQMQIAAARLTDSTK